MTKRKRADAAMDGSRLPGHCGIELQFVLGRFFRS